MPAEPPADATTDTTVSNDADMTPVKKAPAHATASAGVQKSYLVKLLLIALAMGGFGSMFAYDGWVGYPKENERRFAYQELAADTENPVPLGDRWAETAAAIGWSEKTPSEPRGASGILAQKIIFVVLAGLAGYFLWGWLRNVGRYTYATPEGVGDHKGRFAKWEQITEFDDRRWDKKGIIVLRYTSDAGKADRIVLDDYIMDTAPTRRMVDETRAALGIDKPQADAASVAAPTPTEDAAEAPKAE